MPTRIVRNTICYPNTYLSDEEYPGQQGHAGSPTQRPHSRHPAPSTLMLPDSQHARLILGQAKPRTTWHSQHTPPPSSAPVVAVEALEEEAFAVVVTLDSWSLAELGITTCRQAMGRRAS